MGQNLNIRAHSQTLIITQMSHVDSLQHLTVAFLEQTHRNIYTFKYLVYLLYNDSLLLSSGPNSLSVYTNLVQFSNLFLPQIYTRYPNLHTHKHAVFNIWICLNLSLSHTQTHTHIHSKYGAMIIMEFAIQKTTPNFYCELCKKKQTNSNNSNQPKRRKK